MMHKVLATAVTLILSSCAQSDQSSNSENPEGRSETQNIRNFDGIGFSGSEIADKLDASLNEIDERNKRLEDETN